MSASIVSSASASVSTPSGQKQPEYLRPRPEREPEELGGQLVVLVVRRGGLDRDRAGRHRRDRLLERVESAEALAPEAEPAALRDRGAQEWIGEETLRDDAIRDHALTFRFGGSGTNTETSSW